MIKLSKNLTLLVFAIVGILIIVATVFITQIQNGKKTSETLSADKVNTIAQKTLSFINENLLSGISASLIETGEEYGLVKMRLKLGENELDSYVTPDGKLLFPQVINLEEISMFTQEPAGDETSDSTAESNVPLEELEKFIACLKRANFVIYGANWCGWTKQLVETLGGWDMVKPIYVECTENEELCQEKGIRGYPTILVNGKEYQKGRTFVEFGATTNCEVPPGAETTTGGSSSGGCQ